ncbi:hypothetical protein SAMN06295912_14512 [Sphingomonas laterariae]|uniref:Uncharacterized protein n=1 Tax=Edaphosphingomonas laterariae TaxID=861865 RepID=A0A239K5H2_9SPHN|nr:hypothetical protein [Sphingomonas laterariae]SNT12932.1 hypothetical protein SAMN06295912_14512 [Sphingomonas laterariae]
MRGAPKRWREVRAELHPAGEGATGAPAYAQACEVQNARLVREMTSIAEAVGWANRQLWPVDLYLFDAAPA